jgi:hypothetical protein
MIAFGYRHTNVGPSLEWVETPGLSTAIREGSVAVSDHWGFHLPTIALLGGVAGDDIVDQFLLWARVVKGRLIAFAS